MYIGCKKQFQRSSSITAQTTIAIPVKKNIKKPIVLHNFKRCQINNSANITCVQPMFEVYKKTYKTGFILIVCNKKR